MARLRVSTQVSCHKACPGASALAYIAISQYLFISYNIAKHCMPGLGQGHEDAKIIELFSIIAFLMHPRRINAWNIDISEKTLLFNLYSFPLWVFVPWWLNSYD